jgi:hypothetical protein
MNLVGNGKTSINLPDSVGKWNEKDTPSIMVISESKQLSINEEITNNKHKLRSFEKEIPLVKDKVPEASVLGG